MNSPLRLRTEAEFELKAFDLRIKEVSLEDMRSLASDIFRQYLWVKQFFADNIKSDAPTLASLQTQNSEMRNHLEQLKALNDVLRQDVEALKTENSQLKEGQHPRALKHEEYIKTWGYLQDVKDGIDTLLRLLETDEKLDKIFVDLLIQEMICVMDLARRSIPGQNPPERMV